jgi:hypothetical protein
VHSTSELIEDVEADRVRYRFEDLEQTLRRVRWQVGSVPAASLRFATVEEDI